HRGARLGRANGGRGGGCRRPGGARGSVLGERLDIWRPAQGWSPSVHAALAGGIPARGERGEAGWSPGEPRRRVPVGGPLGRGLVLLRASPRCGPEDW